MKIAFALAIALITLKHYIGACYINACYTHEIKKQCKIHTALLIC